MLSMLVGSLRIGYGLLHAISVVKDEMPAPIGPEFGRVRETALGFSIGDALDHLVERVQNDDLALIVTAIHIQNEVGGSLAEVLETICGRFASAFSSREKSMRSPRRRASPAAF